MKKLMFIAVAAIAGSLCAGDQITSANVVGYQQKSVAENAYTFIAPNFKAIGRDLTLADIKVNENATFSGTTLQLLDGGGATRVVEDPMLGEIKATFKYVNATRAAKKGCEEGWYFDDDTAYASCQNSRVIPFGSGLLVDCSDSGAGIVFNGQVSDADTVIVLTEGAYTFTGNCTPKDIAFGDILVNENVTFSGTTIQLLDDGGATRVVNDPNLGNIKATFKYVNASRAAKKGCVVGWYYDDDTAYAACQNDRVLQAGDGVLVDCSDSGAAIIIPSAL